MSVLWSLVGTFLVELAKTLAERFGKTMFAVRTRVRKLKPFDRRKERNYGKDQ